MNVQSEGIQYTSPSFFSVSECTENNIRRKSPGSNTRIFMTLIIIGLCIFFYAASTIIMATDVLLLFNSLNHTAIPVVDPIVGSVYIILAILLLMPYFSCIYIMSTDVSLKGSSFFRIAIHIGITDVLQIFFNSVVGGLLTLTNYQSFWINNSSAAIVGFGWTTCMMVAHLMAFNRFVYVYWPDRVKYLFSHKATNLALLGCWSIGVIWFVVLMNPNVNLVYDLNRYSYIYIRTEWTKYVILVHMGYNIANVIGMLVWYAFIFAKIRTQLRSMVDRSVSKDSRKDLKILAQAVFLCALVIATTITFTIDQYVKTHWSFSFLTNVLFLVCAGSNSFVHIAINSTIKRRFMAMFSLLGSTAPTLATQTPNEAVTSKPNRILPNIVAVEK